MTWQRRSDSLTHNYLPLCMFHARCSRDRPNPVRTFVYAIGMVNNLNQMQMQIASCMCGTHVLRIIHFILITVQTVFYVPPLSFSYNSYVSQTKKLPEFLLISTISTEIAFVINSKEEETNRIECGEMAKSSIHMRCVQGNQNHPSQVHYAIRTSYFQPCWMHRSETIYIWGAIISVALLETNIHTDNIVNVNATVFTSMEMISQHFASMVNFNVFKRKTTKKLRMNLSIFIDGVLTIVLIFCSCVTDSQINMIWEYF